MIWKYKTFLYRPTVGFLQRTDRGSLEKQLNSLGKMGWEYVAALDCRKRILQPREYVILLRCEGQEPSIEVSDLER